jgi:hypothetical protein
MSSTSSTTYDWSCDLCGADAGTNESHFSPPDTLTTFRFANVRQDVRPVDVCAECMTRPIADLAAYLAQRAADDAKPKRVKIVEAS